MGVREDEQILMLPKECHKSGVALSGLSIAVIECCPLSISGSSHCSRAYQASRPDSEFYLCAVAGFIAEHGPTRYSAISSKWRNK